LLLKTNHQPAMTTNPKRQEVYLKRLQQQQQQQEQEKLQQMQAASAQQTA
jgi:hypothetical protein